MKRCVNGSCNSMWVLSPPPHYLCLGDRGIHPLCDLRIPSQIVSCGWTERRKAVLVPTETHSYLLCGTDLIF